MHHISDSIPPCTHLHCSQAAQCCLCAMRPAGFLAGCEKAKPRHTSKNIAYASHKWQHTIACPSAHAFLAISTVLLVCNATYAQGSCLECRVWQ